MINMVIAILDDYVPYWMVRHHLLCLAYTEFLPGNVAKPRGWGSRAVHQQPTMFLY